ncbi:hypothetical protein ACH5RR_011200 [Cinchona calisaya]|uniref:Uncharacterized protein n=1 Tax=Cinchona calisaya TaxID=153742 RepID=A0ABD3A480_9GENT
MATSTRMAVVFLIAVLLCSTICEAFPNDIGNGAMGRNNPSCSRSHNETANCRPGGDAGPVNSYNRGCNADSRCRCCRRMLLEDQLQLNHDHDAAQIFPGLGAYFKKIFHHACLNKKPLSFCYCVSESTQSDSNDSYRFLDSLDRIAVNHPSLIKPPPNMMSLEAIGNGAMGRNGVSCSRLGNNQADCAPGGSTGPVNSYNRGCNAATHCRCCRRMLFEDQLQLNDVASRGFEGLKAYLTEKFHI